ncbi:calcium-binding protein [Rhizobium vallis]|nr:calcium-binding protein [Rhizobium vallis]
MSVSRELMTAILSMDAYNRGYGAGTVLDQNASRIGDAIIDRDSSILGVDGDIRRDISAGFYGIAYEWNGATVISYRGTNAETAANFATDALNGYFVGAGYPQNNQAYLAADFFQAITGTTNLDPSSARVLLTGHSLGGGLAGFIASIYGQEAVIFDNMTFEHAAATAYTLASSWDPLSGIENSLSEIVWGDFYNGYDPHQPLIGENIEAYATANELLTPLRALFSQQTPVTTLDSHWIEVSVAHLVNLHSQALLISLEFARESGHISWTSIGATLWATLFDQKMGAATGFENLEGSSNAASKLLTAIAYSALDSGSSEADSNYGYVFGNTAIRSLFDDADALGWLITTGKATDIVEDAVNGLTEALVQFAGLMAIRKINFHQYQDDPNAAYHPEKGIIGLFDNNGAEVTGGDGAQLLTVNVSQDLWGLGKSSTEDNFINIVGIQTILESLFEKGLGVVDETLISRAMQELYKDPSADDFSIPKAIGSLAFSLSDDPLVQTLGDTANGYDQYHAGLFAATDGDDQITGSDENNIIAGGDGDDTLTGHLGRDLLVGGNGSDTFIDSVTVADHQSGRQNENDVYIGGNENVGLLTDFLEWLVGATETDTVRYTVDNLTEDNPNTPANENALQQEGVRVTDLKVNHNFGGIEALEVTVEDLATGKAGTDILVSIDKIELSDRADELIVADTALDAPILIDMGKSGRIQSELPAGESLSPNAFVEKVDVVDYSGLSHGINYLNGVTSDHDDVATLDNIFQWQGYSQELLTIVDYAAKGALGFNNALHVQGADRVKLSDHDDVLISADFGSIITTGDGQDKIWFTNGIGVTDLSAEDRIAFGGFFTLYGGLKNEANEDPYAWGPYGMKYGLNAAGELVISNAFWHVSNPDGTPSDDVATMYVLNWKDRTTQGPGGGEVGPGGIFLAEYHMYFQRFRDISIDEKGQYSVLGEGAFDILGLMIKTMTGHYPWGGQDPLVLDLDGDGIELTALDRSKSKLDLDNDLYAESSGFVGKDDGILVRDLNGDGKISGSNEMFGNATTSGLAALAALDGNHDGKVDATDNGLADFDGDGTLSAADTFSSLLIWQDSNENHRTDVGELKSVTERGISSINVTANPATPPQTVNGNTITSTAGYTMADGTVRTIADVVLRLDNQNTTYVGAPIAVSQSVLDLADLKGRGTLVSLHEAMSVLPSAAATVRAAVQSLTSPVLSDLREVIRPILTAWAEGSPVKIGGNIVTGPAGLTAYDDLAIVRKDGNVVDYAWGVSSSGDTTSDIPGIRMASGVIVASSGGVSGRGELSDLLSQWTSGSSSVAVTTGTELHNGVSITYLDYSSGDDYLRIYNYGKAAWSSSLASSSSHSLDAGIAVETVAGSDFSFYERLIGESLQAFFDVPDSAAAGYQAVAAFLDKMDDALNLFAVRLAVQSGPLAHYFDSIDYNAGADGFTSKSGTQIAAVFTALLADAEQSSDAVSWLTEWKPFFDVFLSDYSRGSASQKNTYAFLAQNMLNAVEQHTGGISVVDFAHAFGMAQDLFITGTGEVNGSSQDDILIVDGGETVVRGGTGSDNYIIGKSFGSTEIFDDDGIGGSVDTIRFSAHNAGDIIASRDGIDLILTDKVTGAVLRITNEFEGRWPGLTVSDVSHDFGINQIVFKDGSVWTKVDIAEAVSKIDDASTHIVGTADIDVLQGGKGDDLLEGGGDTDIYRFGRGDGQDTINDFEPNAFRNDQDMLQFLTGIRNTDLIFQRDGASSDLVIRFKDNPLDKITIQGQFAATYTGPYGTWYMNRIDLFTFDNGTSLTSDQVASIVLQANSTDGNDQLYGMEREDILRAGKGDDFISGGNQNDIYLYALGDGHDVIQDRMTNILSGTDDILRFGAGIGREDITFGRVDGDRNSIIIYVNGGEGSITLRNEFSYAASGVFGDIFFDRIEQIDFASGDQSIAWYQIATTLIAAAKTDGVDVIEGFNLDDVLDGGAGDDTLYGYDGNDTYVWGRGYGNDTIQERGAGALSGGDYDKIVFNDHVVASDIQLVRDAAGSDLVIKLRDTGETLTLLGQFSYNAINYRPDQVDEIHFSDGVIWNAADIRNQYLLSMKTAGDDTIYGFWTNDTLDGGAGNDYLAGGDGDDTYLFGYGDGQDIIQESYGIVLYSDNDTVRFKSNVDVDDVTFHRVGDYDLLITLAGSNDSLLIRNEYDIAVWDMNDVEQFVFADGTILSKFDLINRFVADQVTEGDDTITAFDFDEVITAGAGADTIDGRGGNDVITGGLGDDNIRGGGGNDTFYYGRGDGNDVVTDVFYNGTDDRLIFTDILPSDVRLERSGNDLRIVIGSAGSGTAEGSVLLKDEFAIDIWRSTGVEEIRFADGTIWKNYDIGTILLSQQATAGADTLNGTDFEDGITGGRGNDLLIGGGGNDTYYYSRGDGNDTIQESYYQGNGDRLVFLDVNPAEVSLLRNGNDVTLVIAESTPGAGDGASILLKETLDDFYGTGLDKIVFANGTTWTRSTLQTILVDHAGTANNDSITGSNSADVINAMAGADTVDGGDGNDLITGGKGNDTLVGGGGNDVFYYSRGDGNDIVREYYYNGGADRLVFTDLNVSDLQFSRSGNDLTIIVGGDTPDIADDGRIVLPDEFNIDIWATTGVEQFGFADGTVLSNAGIASIILSGMITAGNDDILGFVFNETIEAGAGDDTVNAGDGNDLIAGGKGNDTLVGGGGNDVFYYSRGDGNDVVREYYYNGGADRLVFTDLNVSNLRFSRSGNDLTIIVGGDTPDIADDGRIVLTDEFNIDIWATTGVEQFSFADGTVLSNADIARIVLAGMVTPGDDNIVGFVFDDTISAGDGNDTVDAAGGNDLIIGGKGNDILVGGDGNDSITGGIGNDTIVGSYGNDTIYYAHGDGSDTITESGEWDADDRLVLSGINAADVTLVRNGNDVTLVVAESAAGVGDGGSILLKGNLNEYYQSGLEKVVFADGTTWTRDTLRATLLAQASTSGDDLITGFSAADAINAGAGNDTINSGDSNDLITGGIGNDTIVSSYGNDTIYYARGDGSDTITESGEWDADDRLVLSGINAADVTLVRNGNDVMLVVAESAAGAGDSGSILLKGNLNEYYQSGIEKVVFADDTTWTRDTLRATLLAQGSTSGDDMITDFSAADTINAGAGNDTINSGDGNDRIAGGTGNDTIASGGGNDTIYYSRGDGNDTITESGYWDPDDQLVLSGINPTDVTLVRNGNDVTLVIAESVTGAGDGGSILLKGNLNEYYQTGLEKVVFADGTVWGRADLRSNISYVGGTSGNDTVTGTTGADNIHAGMGDDTLIGLAGDDAFVFRPGFGHDTINDFVAGAQSVDIIDLSNDLFADFASVMAAATQVGADTVIAHDSNTSITLKNVALTSLHQDDFRFTAAA